MLYGGRLGEDAPNGRVLAVACTGISLPYGRRPANSPERQPAVRTVETGERDSARGMAAVGVSASDAGSAGELTRQSANPRPREVKAMARMLGAPDTLLRHGSRERRSHTTPLHPAIQRRGNRRTIGPRKRAARTSALTAMLDVTGRVMLVSHRGFRLHCSIAPRPSQERRSQRKRSRSRRMSPSRSHGLPLCVRCRS